MNKPKLRINVFQKVFKRITEGEQNEFYREEKAMYQEMFNDKGHVKIENKWYNVNEIVLVFHWGHERTYREAAFECTSLRVGQGKKEWGGFNDWSFIIGIGKQIKS